MKRLERLYSDQRLSFPDPLRAGDDGVVTLSDDLHVNRLLEAYSFGIFPWPHADRSTLWYCPSKRGVLDFSDFHVPKSLQKQIRRAEFRYTFNRRFASVIEACARVPRQGQGGTWITERLLYSYVDFHRAGYAHSLEVWCGENLIGGLYGVYVAGVFCGESMFFLRSNASKLALVHLVMVLQKNGLTWMDIQMVTPVLQSMGGKYISRAEFIQRLETGKASARPLIFP